MEIFVTTLVIVIGVLAVLGAPLFVIAWRKGRVKTARNFMISASVIAILSATLATVSERQVAQCLAAGNSDCFDSGAAGLQLLFVVIYVLVAWTAATLIWRD